MSIIHDALKKIEKSVPPGSGEKPEGKVPKIKLYSLYALVLILGFVMAGAFFKFILPLSPSPKSPIVKAKEPPSDKKSPRAGALSKMDSGFSAAKINQPAQVLKGPEAAFTVSPLLQQPKPSLILNGIFFAQDAGYALINNRIVKEGDIIEGAQLESITVQNVKLNFQGQVIILSTQPE